MVFKRQPTKIDDLFVITKHGENLEIPVVLDAAIALPRYNKAEAVLQYAKQKASQNPNSEKAVEELGKAALAQLAVVFGEDGVAQMYNFYDKDILKMLRDAAPYIKQRVLPVLRASSKKRRRKVMKEARRK